MSKRDKTNIEKGYEDAKKYVEKYPKAMRVLGGLDPAPAKESEKKHNPQDRSNSR